MNICAVVLAAGKGTRMQSKYHKGTHKICGKEMVNIIIDKLVECGVNDINLVVGEHRDNIIDVTKCKGVSYSLQEDQLGTGHAVMSSMDFLRGRKGNLLIFPCDTPLLSKDNIKNLMHVHIKDCNSVTVVTSFVESGLSYGRIVRKDGKICCIREAKDCTQDELLINEVNSSVYCFDIESLLDEIENIGNDNVQNEFYLTDMVEIFTQRNKRVGSVTVDKDQVVGVDSRVQLSYANKLMRDQINNYHMNNGVTILDPSSTYIDIDVKIGRDVVIHPNVCVFGKSLIEEDCEIFSNTKVVESVIGKNTKVESSIIYQSTIGESTSIGPFAYLRPGSVIGNKVKIGDFVEIKNSDIGDCTKISHLSYVGDSHIGKRCNLGCGIITVNYDGKEKNESFVGDDCFIGCNSNLIAPVVVEDRAYVAAGTTVTERVNSNSLAIGRCYQKNIENWVINKFK